MRVALLLLVVIVSSEIGIMLLFSWLDLERLLSPIALAFSDALLLSFIIAFPLYHWVIRPLKTTIRSSQAKLNMLASAVENAGDAIIITSRSGKVEYVNQAFKNMSLYGEEDIIGKPVSDFEPFMAKPLWKKSFLQSIRSSGVWKDEQWEKKKNGDEYLAEITVTPIDMYGVNKISHFVTIKQDNTKRFELENQLRQAQKMEAIGTLVGGIAHDFNNMLSGLTGQLYLAKGKTKDNPEVFDRLSKMETLTFHASDMISQLLTFARKGVVSKTDISFNSFVKEACKLARVGLPENINFSYVVPEKELVVHADATQMQQLVMNLINNARDALEGVESPNIEVSLSCVDDDYSALRKFHPDSHSYAMLCIHDNGCGISEENIAKIMDPFFTTKEQGKGTGLGLSMVHGVVKTHHGFIDIDSTVGKGSAFSIFLPLSEESIVKESEPAEIVIGNGETVLLVDDDVRVRETGREVLEHIGYRVLDAEDGAVAIKLCREHAGVISAVIMDIVMPELQGIDAAKVIKGENPSMPVVLMTGYDRNSLILNEESRMLVDGMISKPYSVGEISRVLHDILRVEK